MKAEFQTKIRQLVALTALAASAAGIGGCTTTYVTPTAVASPARADRTRDQSIPAETKTFSLPNDWQYGPWIMKRGASVEFRADGTGHFSCKLYSQATSPSPIELHFQSIQFGRDGNRLFTFPLRDDGIALHIRRPYTDFVYDIDFGFDPRLFSDIQEAKFYARVLLDEEQMGGFNSHGTLFTRWLRFDKQAPGRVIQPTVR
jgi:hypothetical protein